MTFFFRERDRFETEKMLSFSFSKNKNERLFIQRKNEVPSTCLGTLKHACVCLDTEENLSQYVFPIPIDYQLFMICETRQHRN